LFANTYLAMRVAFFNELDSYSLASDIYCREIIDGVSLDPLIGEHYNNPSFGYGGYCLPKDTKQLLSNYAEIPQNLIEAIVSSNKTRANFLADKIMEKGPKTVGAYRLVMKLNSDNMRNSAIKTVIEILIERGVNVLVYEPLLPMSGPFPVERDLNEFFKKSDVIISNRMTSELIHKSDKILCRDLFEVN
jgi:UDPglucose 6-dehydrogenase